MHKLIIFDMDGVLIDSKKAWYTVFNKALEHFEGRKVNEQEFDEKIWSIDFAITHREYFKADMDDVINFFNNSYDVFQNGLGIFDGVKETLEKLSKNYKIAVATNSGSHLAKKMLEQLKIWKYFDSLIGGDEVRKAKPDPEMILKIINKFKLTKEECILIGDSEYDEEAAKNAGIDFIGFRMESKKSCTDFRELLVLVQSYLDQ